jgi:hypothetical protein
MKRILQVIAILLAVGAMIQAVTTHRAEADTKSTKDAHEPGV